jgi:hypothetical protein
MRDAVQLLLVSLLLVMSAAESLAAQQAPQEQLPPGVEQIIPRGRIAAIVDPQFVSAEKAKIPGDAWVLGVAIGGQARAYSLNLLNRHEVVNDTIGDTAFAAVW